MSVFPLLVIVQALAATVWTDDNLSGLAWHIRGITALAITFVVVLAPMQGHPVDALDASLEAVIASGRLQPFRLTVAPFALFLTTADMYCQMNAADLNLLDMF